MAFNFGLNDCKIAPWTSDGVWGTAVDVNAGSMFSAELQTVTAQLEGDDVIKDTHAKSTSVQMTLQFGFDSLAVYEILTGVTLVEGTGYDGMQFNGDNFPYFGVCAKALDTSGGGDLHVFLPKVKLTQGFRLQMQYGQYNTPELTAIAVYDSVYGIMRPVHHDVAKAVAIPLLYAA